MMKLIPRSSMKQMPWKNGQGLTTEIAIHPTKARFPEDKFLWRISCAKIQSPNTFSIFEDYDRLLVLWHGSGLLLNGSLLKPFVPFKFSGKKMIESTPVDGEVVDLGIIYRRDLFEVDCEVLFLNSKETKKQVLVSDMTFLFCAQGKLSVGEWILNEGDASLFETSCKSISLFTDQSAICIRIELKNRSVKRFSGG